MSEHASDIEQAGSAMGARRGNLWFVTRGAGGATSWRFAPLDDEQRARELALELNALPFEEAAERFEVLWQNALRERGLDPMRSR